MPVWDLSLVLRALLSPHFEPLHANELKVLSFKTALLACEKLVVDMQVLSVNSACIKFGMNYCMVRIIPRAWLYTQSAQGTGYNTLGI